ncbi:DUF4222 domain-containing protein [Klebsiella quasipneumoniae]|uniref:DUF4222 domain-containing protein n=2 Tax=Klebsiella quasipneumoniae TaxID=1463165 RepID=UPI0015E51993|nr:DUF4222 domain-containing protein [Klebsiella quasipneumoniae]QLP57733.1 DUF4222 domain-containing protein [Klebsiella quasipneumoniae]HEB4943640.1 DUF4222 domain-containing protein [Klebsiella quasipneumoniae]
MCNQSAAELIARLKRAYPAYEPSEGDRASNGIPKAGARFKHARRGHVVTVLRSSSQRVVFCREGYFSECEVGRREFEMKFKKVQDES